MKKAGKVEKEKLKSKSYSKIIWIVILLVFVLIAFALVLKYPRMTGNYLLSTGYHDSGYANPSNFFNMPYDTFNLDSTNQDVILDLAVNKPNSYVFKIGYFFNTRLDDWVPFQFLNDTIGSSNWINGTSGASTSLRINATNNLVNGENYIVTYACMNIDGVMKCGCEDTLDTVCNKWMLRVFNVSGIIRADMPAIPTGPRTSSVYTYLNGARGGIKIAPGTSIWLNASRITGEGNVNLYLNGNLINSGVNIGNLTLFSSIGIYNITAIQPATPNYFSSSETFFVNVTSLMIPDLIYPKFSTYKDNNGSLINSGLGIFNVSLIDTNGTVWLEINGQNIKAGNISLSFYNASYTFVSSGIYQYRWGAYGNGTNRNVNYSETRSYNVKSSDLVYPIFSNPLASVPTNLEYNPSRNYQFNITIANTNGSAGIEFAGKNYSISNISNSFFFNAGNLGAGTPLHYFWAYGNGVNKNFNRTDNFIYVVAKNSSYALSIGGTTPITYGTPSDFVGAGCPLSLTCSMNYANQVLGAGSWIFNYSTTGNANYSANSITRTLVVNKAPSLVYTYLNNSRNNITIHSGTLIWLNASRIIGVSNVNLYLNGNLINSGMNIANLTFFNSIGLQNVTAIQPASQNHSSSSETFWVNVTSAPDTVYPSLSNIILSPLTNSLYAYNQNYIFNATITNSNGTSFLNFNNINYSMSNISNLYTRLLTGLSAGTYNYYFWAYGNGSSHLYNSSQIFSYVVNMASLTAKLTNTTSWIVTYPTQTNISLSESNMGDTDVNYLVYRDNRNIGKGENSTLGVGTYIYVLNSTGGANYSSSSNLDTKMLTVLVNNSAQVYTYLNNTQNNISIYNNTAIWLNASLNLNGILTLYKNGTMINRGFSPLSNLTGFTSLGLFNITAIYSGNVNYSGSSQTFWVNVTLALDMAYPIFSNYKDNNGTLTNSGLGIFNVSLLNTNGSVWLEINSQSIQARNTSFSVYNASYSFSNSGTYQYRWVAYGNGTNRNVNYSETRSFDVLGLNITNVILINESKAAGGIISSGENVTINVTVTGASSVWVTIWQGAIGGPILIIQQLVNIINDLWSWTLNLGSLFVPGNINYTVYANNTLGVNVSVNGSFNLLAFDGGSGTLADPYRISTWTQLNNIRRNLTASYLLVANLSSSSQDYQGIGNNWQPIGDNTNSFNGNFDGKGNYIKNLIINLPSQAYVGLFGYSLGNISNTLVFGDIKGWAYVGGLVGWQERGVLTNCSIFGNVSANSREVGGLIGRSRGLIFDSTVFGNINGGLASGGLVGISESGKIDRSYFIGTIKGFDRIGGLAGYVSSGIINNSYSIANISGTSSTGGIIGYGSWAKVTHSYSSGIINGSSDTGGIIGYAYGSVVSNVSFLGNILGSVNTGGLIGQDSGSSLSNSYSIVNITGANYTGGLVGIKDSGTIVNSYSKSNIISTGDYSGGLIGYSNTNIVNSYSISNVSADISRSVFIGGLVGYQNISSTITNCSSNANVIGFLNVGGLVGWQNNGSIYNSSSNANVKGGLTVGGLVGYSQGNISSSYVIGNVNSSGAGIGGLAGQQNGFVINNCSFKGNVSSSSQQAGGLVGRQYANSVISNSFVVGNITSSNIYLGGLVGYAEGNIFNSYFSGSLIGSSLMVGGIAGFTFSNTLVTNCSSVGRIIGSDDTGGIVGKSWGNISNSSSYADISGGNHVGGISGLLGAYGNVFSSFFAGKVNAITANAGGIVGYGGTVWNSYSIGNISSLGSYCGGISGSNSVIRNSFSIGEITCDYIGGIIGSIGTIYNSFSTSKIISASTYRGGITGQLSFISKVYWDIGLSGQSSCYSTGSTGCTSTNNQASLYYGASGIPFANLGFSTGIWTPQINNYPKLKWQ